MIPFVVLFVVFGGLHVLRRVGVDPAALRSGPARMRVALASMFLVTGISHFTSPESLLVMIPDFLPLRREAVFLSGIAELAGAAGLFIPQLRRLAGLGLVAMLVVVFPANINVALNNLQIDLVPSSPVYQWARLLMQPLLVWFVAWASGLVPRPPRHGAVAGAGLGRVGA